MKSFEITEFGIDKLTIRDVEVPRPGPGEALVRLQAASLNYRDLMVVQGTYNPKLKRPMVPLSDGCGVVEDVGAGVTRVKAGDRVAPCFFQTWIDGPPSREKFAAALGGGIAGVLREYAVFREEGLVHAPEILTSEEVACLPCAGVTAWHALFEHTNMAPGGSVLIQGTGGVSTFALLFAKAAGFRTIVTSGSDEKLGRVRDSGASHVINYREHPDWEEQARTLTGGRGVDNVIEVGGSDTLSKSFRAARTGGAVSVIGVLSGRDTGPGPGQILVSSLRVQGIYVGSRAMFERMNQAIEFHNIKPVIDRVFAWTDFPEALRYMEAQKHFGKICLKFT
ncbi:MAG TPA: NAD(P)-dependent alcohol dehydrogenase [Bryobacteraceae bacterium]|jgi:NADPH:quinone reductase-like Zn-dependent oxidoreductase|nr:NAD(P)-dependent alcohol dehydrogenase [Bryobacteraceae bacterium]